MSRVSTLLAGRRQETWDGDAHERWIGSIADR